MASTYQPPTSDDFFNLTAGDPDEAPPDYFNRRFLNWMSFLNGSCKLTDLVIPGTHESATYSMRDWMTGAPGSFPTLLTPSALGEFDSQTQGFNLLGQLLAGVRYFDLRVETNSSAQPIFHHGSGSVVDCSGRLVEQVFQTQLAPFFQRFPTEFVILDFQEISAYVGDPATTLSDLIDLFNTYLNPEQWAAWSGSFTPGMTLDTVRQNGWQYVALFSPAAIAAALNAGVAIPGWVVPRWPGNTVSPNGDPPIPAGAVQVLWSPWNESTWNGGAAGIVTAIANNGTAWQTNGQPNLYVAQAVQTPTTFDSVTADAPLTNEAVGFGVNPFSTWIAGMAAGSTVPPVNIIIRDALDWFPETLNDILRLNLIKGNVAAAAQPLLQILLAAGANVHFVPLVTGTATGNWFAQNSAYTANNNYYFDQEIDNAQLKSSGWVLEAGTPNLPGAAYATDSDGKVLNNADYDSKSEGAWHTWQVNPLPAGTVISYIQLRSMWNDGTNGWFRVNNGWVLQDALDIHVNGYPTRGTHWQLTVQTVSNFGPACCFYNPSSDG